MIKSHRADVLLFFIPEGVIFLDLVSLVDSWKSKRSMEVR